MMKELKSFFIKNRSFLIYSSALLIIIFYSYYSSYRSHIRLPEGCDEFGYLNLAKAITRGSVFTNHAERPFIKNLIQYLEHFNLDKKYYYWMVAPHAYHVDSRSKNIINQYPPGTSLLLSPIPIYLRQFLFTPICMLVFFVLLYKALISYKTLNDLNIIAVIFLLIFIFSYFYPFKEELHRINSLLPTWGILIASSFLLCRKSYFSFALLGLSCLFRIVNVIFFPIYLLIFIYESLRSNAPETFADTKHGLSKIISISSKAIICFMLGGVLYYFIYMYFLTGNIFSFSYSSMDREWITLNMLSEQLQYYFNPSQLWMRVHLFSFIILSALVFFTRNSYRMISYATMIISLNYLFFIFHKIKTPYYPYASAMIIIGFIIHMLSYTFKKKSVNLISIIILFLISSYFITVISISQPLASRKKIFKNLSAPYKEFFIPYDVVWGEQKTGTVEYTTGKAAFRYHWGDPDTRKLIIRWLFENNYNQAFWIDDINIGIDDIKNELNELKIPFGKKSHPQLGTIVSPKLAKK